MGLDKVKKWKSEKSYRRNGEVVIKKQFQRLGTNFKLLVAEPHFKWFPSKYANFTFGVLDKPPAWYMEQIPAVWNGSLWMSEKHEDHYVLRVPKDCRKEVVKRLNEKFWFSGKKWMWFLRQRKRKK